jgi:heat shock protein HslJ
MMTFRMFAWALWPGLGLAGCASTVEKPANVSEGQPVAAKAAGPQSSGLTGTEWRLVEIQSMDDAQGTKRPEDPSRYSMRLGADGTATLTLNCNMATGTWTSEPVGDGTSGRFSFGPLAATAALCPQPGYDEQISRQAPYIRSFLLKDGRLYLSLMADGGIWAWEPADGVPFQATPDPALEQAIRQVEKDYTRAVTDAEGAGGLARYVYGRIDLNADGRSEVLVYLLGSIFCGTGGCTTLIFTETPDGYRLVSEFSISRPPFVVASQTSKGWSDLIYLQSGGGAPSAFFRFSWNGNRYVEKERLPGDTVPAGRPQLVGDLTFEQGIQLEPGN